MKEAANKYATFSLSSTISTGIFTSVHHHYEIGNATIYLVLLFIVLPTILIGWFLKNGSEIALWIYWLINAWLLLGVGLVDGLMSHAVKLIGIQIHELVALHGGSTSINENSLEGIMIYEITGTLTFITALFAGYYGVKLIRSIKNAAVKSEERNY